MFADVDEYLYPARLVSRSPSAHDDAVLQATSRTMLQRFLQSEVMEEELRYKLKASRKQAHLKRPTGCRRVGQVSVACLVFGPSGHRRPPRAGMSAGYTCRLRHSERHKVFVLADALVPPMLSVVHNFESLKEAYCTVNSKLNSSVFFHYKYPAWDDFKSKFYRRAGKEDGNGSPCCCPCKFGWHCGPSSCCLSLLPASCEALVSGPFLICM